MIGATCAKIKRQGVPECRPAAFGTLGKLVLHQLGKQVLHWGKLKRLPKIVFDFFQAYFLDRLLHQLWTAAKI